NGASISGLAPSAPKRLASVRRRAVIWASGVALNSRTSARAFWRSMMRAGSVLRWGRPPRSRSRAVGAAGGAEGSMVLGDLTLCRRWFSLRVSANTRRNETACDLSRPPRLLRPRRGPDDGHHERLALLPPRSRQRLGVRRLLRTVRPRRPLRRA